MDIAFSKTINKNFIFLLKVVHFFFLRESEKDMFCVRYACRHPAFVSKAVKKHLNLRTIINIM